MFSSISLNIVLISQCISYPEGNCSVFKFQPFLHKASDKRKISNTFEPMATTEVAGLPKMKMPSTLRRLKKEREYILRGR